MEDISTPGDIRVEVPNGNLTNASTTVQTDPMTEQQLLNMYAQMEATGSAAQTSVSNTLASYDAAQTQDYQTYWNFRNSMSDDLVGGLAQGQTYYVVVGQTENILFQGKVTGGSFTLTYGGQTTAPIAYNASAAVVGNDLANLSSIGSGNVLVGGGAGAWTVTFNGSLSGQTPSITADGSGLTGTTPGIELTEGVNLSTTDPSKGAPTYASITASSNPGNGGAQQRLYLGSTGSYVTFDDSSSTIIAGTISLSGVTGGTLTNGEQVTFERWVPYSTSQTVTLSAAQTAAYTAYYTQEAHYRAITGVANGQLSFASAHGFTTGQAVVYEADGAEIDITGGGSLVNGQTYYVIAPVNDPTGLELASTEANAQAGIAIKLADAPNLTGTPGLALVNDPVSGRTDLTNYVNGAIQTLEAQQTTEYQSLNAIWGQVGNIEEGTAHYDGAFGTRASLTARAAPSQRGEFCRFSRLGKRDKHRCQLLCHGPGDHLRGWQRSRHQ